MSLVIGTAQFGLHYGVSNHSGLTKPLEISRILDIARKSNILSIDTASAYGLAEDRLGTAGVTDFRVISKFPSFHCSPESVFRLLEEHLIRSLSRLRIDHLYCFMLHDPSVIFSDQAEAYLNALTRLKEAGFISKIGISIYDSQSFLDSGYSTAFDLVQVPSNVFDRRLINSNLYQILDHHNIEIHVRSVFLQGLLLMPSTSIPSYLKQYLPLIQQWHSWCREARLQPLTASLSFVRCSAPNAKIVVGIETSTQLLEILQAYNKNPKPIPLHLQSEDLNLIDPSRWNKNP